MECGTHADLQQQKQQHSQFEQQHTQQQTQQNFNEKEGLNMLNVTFEDLLHRQKVHFQEYKKRWEEQNRMFWELQKQIDQNWQSLRESLRKLDNTQPLQKSQQPTCPVSTPSSGDKKNEQLKNTSFECLQEQQNRTIHEVFQQPNFNILKVEQTDQSTCQPEIEAKANYEYFKSRKETTKLTTPIISDNLLEDEQVQHCTSLYQPEVQAKACSKVPKHERIAGGTKPLIAHHGAQCSSFSTSVAYKEDSSGITQQTSTSQADELLLFRGRAKGISSLQRERKIDIQFRSNDRIYVLLFYTRRNSWLAESVVHRVGVSLFEIQIQLQKQPQQTNIIMNTNLSTVFRLVLRRNSIYLLQGVKGDHQDDSVEGKMFDLANESQIGKRCYANLSFAHEEVILNRGGCCGWG